MNYTAKDFRNILINKNYDLNKDINYNEFINILNDLNNANFNEDLAEELFDKMDHNRTGNSNLNVFCDILLEGINTIQRKINNNNTNIKEYQTNNNNIEINLRNSDNYNLTKNYEDGKKLVLNIIEVENLDDEDALIEIETEDRLIQNFAINNLDGDLLM